MNPITDFDWGRATPEAYNDVNREALHVLNVNLVGDSNRRRALKFVCARILHFAKQLPRGSSQRIRFDLRGQMIGNSRLDQMRRVIVEESSRRGIEVAV